MKILLKQMGCRYFKHLTFISIISAFVFCQLTVKAAGKIDGNAAIANVNATAEVVAIAIEASASVVSIDESVNISGSVVLSPNSRFARGNLLRNKVKLISINSNGEYGEIIETGLVLKNRTIRYEFKDVRMDVLGVWRFQASIEAGSISSSELISVEVKGSQRKAAGYAVIVEGRAKGDSGIESHNLTTMGIYNLLLNRGFLDDDIYNFNFDASQAGVDEEPARANVLDIITNWAGDKMNDVPAPLYLIFVGHGERGEFLIFPDEIEADDLVNALQGLEASLTGEAGNQPIVTVIGANHSGSFIPALSKSGSNRVVITSCDSNEIAYKGGLAIGDAIRHGDYFVFDLFNQAAKGHSLKRAYEIATHNISEYTENEIGNGMIGADAGNGQYFDKSGQHPLLDDNGDGVGSFGELSSFGGKDGNVAFGVFLGIDAGVGFLEIEDVTQTIVVEPGESGPQLFVDVNNSSFVSDVWVEIASPGHILTTENKNTTEQQTIELPVFRFNDFDAENSRYIWNDFSENSGFDDFTRIGEYEVFYFAKDKNGLIASFKESDVYKNEEFNKPPSSFSPVSPKNGAQTAVALVFDWEDSIDPDIDPLENEKGEEENVSYTLTLSLDKSFNDIFFQRKKLKSSFAVVDREANLRDKTTYFWTVTAFDVAGGTTQMSGNSAAFTLNEQAEPISFTSSLSNGFPGFIKGVIFDNDTASGIAGATIAVNNQTVSIETTKNGSYFIELPSGQYSVSYSAGGYESKNGAVAVNSISTTLMNIGLSRVNNIAAIFGRIDDNETLEPIGAAKITLANKTTRMSTSSDDEGRFEFNQLKAGTYMITALKPGYKKASRSINLGAEDSMELNLSLQKR